jgi:glutathione-regulated potassium-efflux system ancillary protein KefG
LKSSNEPEPIRRGRIHEGKPQMTTLILLFHPNSSRSRANAALADAARSLDGVEIIDMTALYPDGLDMERDGERESARLIDAERIVLQFPMQWYSTPALMKDWQDTVLTRMGYIHPDTEGAKLAGKQIMIAATMGAEEATYGREGRNLFTVEELLAPLRATANRFAMDWQKPFLLHSAGDLDTAAVATARLRYRAALTWLAAPSAPARAA